MDDEATDRSARDDIAEDAAEDHLEVSSLDGESVRAQRPWRSVLLLNRRRARYIRYTRPVAGLLTIALVFAVAGALVWRSTPDPTAALHTLTGATTSTPTATSVLGANVLVLTHSVPWGVLTLDGKYVTPKRLPGGPIGVSLTRGHHTLVYAAQSFPTQRCVVSAPAAASDTCPTDLSADGVQAVSTLGLARPIDLGDIPQRLTPANYRALTDAIRGALARAATQETLHAGDRYLAPDGSLATAHGGERFGVSYSLSWLATSQTPQSAQTPCVSVCAPTFPTSATLHALQWPLQVVGVIPEFTVTDTAGGVTPIAPNILGATPPWMTLTAATSLANGHWRVTIAQDPAYASVAYVAVDRFTVAPGGASPEIALPSRYSGYSVATDDHPLAGCLITLFDDSGAPGPKALWRYGAVFAVDDLAQQDFPTLPRANGAEQAVADSIAEHDG